jgi:hypothetical protein
MRLTNEELYRYAQEKYDKANNPHVTRSNFKLFYEEARHEWLALTNKDFELTDKRRNDLRVFTKKNTFTGDKYLIPDDVLYIKSVNSFFVNSCNDNRGVPVQPKGMDEINENINNPFLCPSDEEPAYIEYDGFLEIVSNTMPTKSEFIFIKKPNEFDIIGNPNGFTEEDRQQQEQILDIAVAKIKLKFTQQIGYQAMTNSEIPRNE